MTISIFDMFTIGIGPTVCELDGPMRAARRFVETLRAQDVHALIDGLREHASREEAVFYGWADAGR